MDENNGTLTDEERKELEELRAEKRARAKREQEARDAAELNQLREEKQRSEHEKAEAERIAAQREKGRELMEPDDDLRMPLGQKIVLIAIAVIAVAFILSIILG